MKDLYAIIVERVASDRKDKTRSGLPKLSDDDLK